MEGIFFEFPGLIDRLDEAGFLRAVDLEFLALDGIAYLKGSSHKSADMPESFLFVGGCLEARDFEFFVDCAELSDFTG